MKIACALYDGFTALDIIGPYQVLGMIPGAETFFVAQERGLVPDDSSQLRIEATRSFAETRDPDIVVVPGGIITHTLIAKQHPILAWLRDVHPRTQWTTSVCTGSLLLAGAGLLRDLEATSHWMLLDMLGTLGAKPSPARVVFANEKIVTAAGVSSGIDMGLALVERMLGRPTAEMIQLAIEYDPQPPVDSGSVAKARPETVTGVQQLFGAALARAS